MLQQELFVFILLSYHLVRAPDNFKHSFARSFWFLHSLRPLARHFWFRWSTARRKRRKNWSLLSRSGGAFSSSSIFNRRHHPSIALKSGEHFG